MITYHYRAMTADGAKTRGVVQAVDEYAAVEKIKQTCPIVLQIKPVEEKKGLLTMEIGSKKIDTKALSVMCSQFAIILKSGVSITTCMEMIADQTQDKKLKKMLEKAAADVQQGSGIASSFQRNCKELPVTFVETIRAGEESGTIDQSFASLEKYYEKAYKTRQKVKQAMSYPIFVLCVAAVVLMVVMVKVVPTLAGTFADLGGEMPGITKGLIATSNFLSKNIILIIIAVLALIMGFRFWVHTEKGREKWSSFMLRIPVLGRINKLNGSGQFANTMATLIRSGLTVGHALEITSQVMDNYTLGLETSRMTGSIEEGKRLGDCMRECKYFPKTLVEMCALGEETGELEMTLETTGTYFDNEAQHATTKALSKLEPTMLLFLTAIAGFIVIAIYLPMFTVYNLI